jgi:hypothetical protein
MQELVPRVLHVDAEYQPARISALAKEQVVLELEQVTARPLEQVNPPEMAFQVEPGGQHGDSRDQNQRDGEPEGLLGKSFFQWSAAYRLV